MRVVSNKAVADALRIIEMFEAEFRPGRSLRRQNMLWLARMVRGRLEQSIEIDNDCLRMIKSDKN